MSIAGNNGKCCECSQMTGCDCEGDVPSSLSCRSKSGIATLCGFPEFTDPSDPPILYKQMVLSGINSANRYIDSACATPNPAGPEISCTHAATWRWDVSTCSYSLTSAGTFNCDDGTTGPEGGPPGAAPVDDCSATWSVTKTTITGAPTGSCCSNGGIDLGYGRNTAVGANWALSDEDTEDDAEARAAAAITDWSACISCLECSSWRSDRSGTSDTIFGFGIVQTKVLWTAVVGTTYRVTVHFARRVLGSGGVFLDTGHVFESTITPSTTSGTTDWIDVPNEAGWDTIAYKSIVELTGF